MESRALRFSGLREAAFERARNFEQPASGIGLDRLLVLRFAAALGELVETVGGQLSREGALLPAFGRGRAILGRFAGLDFELVAVIGAALSGKCFDAHQAASARLELVHEIRVGELTEYPQRLIIEGD